MPAVDNIATARASTTIMLEGGGMKRANSLSKSRANHTYHQVSFSFSRSCLCVCNAASSLSVSKLLLIEIGFWCLNEFGLSLFWTWT